MANSTSPSPPAPRFSPSRSRDPTALSLAGVVLKVANYFGLIAPPAFRWSYSRFAKPGAAAPVPDESLDMLFEKKNAALDGFNLWTINGVSFPSTPNGMSGASGSASFHLRQGKRYRLRLRNASDDIHPIHLHRHSFEVVSIAGKPTAGVLKDVFMLNGYQEAEIAFVADNPGLTLFHCHRQLHMDFGFMTLFDYVSWDVRAFGLLFSSNTFCALLVFTQVLCAALLAALARPPFLAPVLEQPRTPWLLAALRPSVRVPAPV